MSSRSPVPRPSISSPTLTRPDWTRSENRDPDRLWLDKNENADPQLAAIVRQILGEIPSEALWSYPDSASLYRKLAQYVGVEPKNLVLATGSDGVIRSVFEAFIAPGDVVIHTDPTFAMYSVYSQMYDADIRTVTYRRSNHCPILPVDELLSLIRTTGPRLICLPNPDSPSGTVLSAPDLQEVIIAAGEAGAAILIDEAYHPFYPVSVAGDVERYPHLVVARSTGKAWGMAGLRIGYGIACSELAATLHKVRPMYETSTVAVATFERMLDHEEEMQASVYRLLDGKAIFLKSMEELGFSTHAGHGNFLHVSFGDRAELIHKALADIVYYRKDFSQDCLRGFSRFSVTTAERFQPVIDRVRQAVAGGEGR